MRNIKFTIFVALSLVGVIAAASDEVAMDEKPSFFASQTMTITAVVEAIDHETRVVTLRKPQGDTVTFTAGEEARNLDQVAVGDIVNAEYEEILSIEVVANDGLNNATFQIHYFRGPVIGRRYRRRI